MGKHTLKKGIYFLFLCTIFACSEPNPIEEVIVDREIVEKTTGRVAIRFIYNDNEGCSVRNQLLIAKTHRDLYITKQYAATPNIYYNKDIYEVELEPGDYVYMATLVCVCSMDKCARLGYGRLEDTKEFVDEFSIEKGKTTYVTTFNMDEIPCK